MYLLIEVDYYGKVAIPVSADMATLLNGLEKAKVVDKQYPNKRYKIKPESNVTYSFLPDSEFEEEEPIVETLRDDLYKAQQRTSEETAKRREIEQELNELKEKFAPFLEQEENKQ